MTSIIEDSPFCNCGVRFLDGPKDVPFHNPVTLKVEISKFRDFIVLLDVAKKYEKIIVTFVKKCSNYTGCVPLDVYREKDDLKYISSYIKMIKEYRLPDFYAINCLPFYDKRYSRILISLLLSRKITFNNPEAVVVD